MTPSKQNKINKNKLQVLQHPGVLQMLCDFVGSVIPNLNQAEIVEMVSVTAAKLKVFYMANITPVVESKQVDLIEAIESMKALYPSKQNKKKK